MGQEVPILFSCSLRDRLIETLLWHATKMKQEHLDPSKICGKLGEFPFVSYAKSLIPEPAPFEVLAV